jgi:cation transport protein ChaC
MATEASHWIFGYGSLMWNPGFPFLHSERARLTGFHRELCVYSYHYRGRPEKPGLVFGLDRGGSCNGIAFEVADGNWAETQAYLQKREQITMVYRELRKRVVLGDGRQVEALTYVVDRTHAQCACGLPDEEIAALVRQGEGEAGSNIDYVRNTYAHLWELGIHDPHLARIVALVG